MHNNDSNILQIGFTWIWLNSVVVFRCVSRECMEIVFQCFTSYCYKWGSKCRGMNSPIKPSPENVVIYRSAQNQVKPFCSWHLFPEIESVSTFRTISPPPLRWIINNHLLFVWASSKPNPFFTPYDFHCVYKRGILDIYFGDPIFKYIHFWNTFSAICLL